MPLSGNGITDDMPDSDTRTLTKQGDHVVCSYIMKSYEALIRSFQSELDQTSQTALELTLASVRRRLPDELADQLRHTENGQQPGPSADDSSPTYVGQASDIFFFETVETCMRHHASDPCKDDLREQYYDQTNIPKYTTLLGRPLLFPSRDEGDRYLDIYFSTIHLAYPFLSRPLIYAQYEDAWGRNLKDPQDGPMLAILSMFNFFFFFFGSGALVLYTKVDWCRFHLRYRFLLSILSSR